MYPGKLSELSFKEEEVPPISAIGFFAKMIFRYGVRGGEIRLEVFDGFPYIKKPLT